MMMDTEFYFTFSEPLVCTAIHNGHSLSTPVKDNCGLSEDYRAREEDLRTGYFTRIGVNRIVQNRSRFEYDLNRTRDRAFYLDPGDAWGLVVRKELPDKELIENCLTHYDIFYRRVRLFFKEMLKCYSSFCVLDIHSYNHHRRGPDEPLDDPAKNPEIILGTSNMPQKWFPLVDQLRERLTSYEFMGRRLDVRINIKFPGGHFPRWIHDNYGNRVCAVAIEYKKIFMNEWTGEFYPEVLRELRQALKSTKPFILKQFNV